jgi:hypothetical protein
VNPGQNKGVKETSGNLKIYTLDRKWKYLGYPQSNRKNSGSQGVDKEENGFGSQDMKTNLVNCPEMEESETMGAVSSMAWTGLEDQVTTAFANK